MVLVIGLVLGFCIGCGAAYAAWRYVFGKPQISLK